MAQFDLYIDVVGQQLIGSPNSPLVATPPPFVQGDTPTFRIFLCQPTANALATPPYTIMPIQGLSLQAAIGDKIGNVTNYYTQQFTWAPSTDPTNPNYFIAQFPMNTAAITTLLGANSSAQSTFHVLYIQAGFPTTVLELPITIQAAVIKNGGVIVPPGATFLSAETANATFLKQTVVGVLYLKNANTGKRVALYLADDGTFHADPVSP